MKKQESSVLADLNKSPISSGHKLSSQGKFTMSCRAFCCCVFFTGAVLSFILSTILLFGVENYHKADPVKAYEIFETPKYALTNQLLDNNKYLILYGQSSSGILNFIEHEANLRVIEGKPVVIRQLDQNIIKKHMKETKHFVEMYLGQVGRGHHSWFILLNDTEAPTHEITSLQKKYPHDTIVLLTPKQLQIEGFTSHKFPALKTKQLKDFMQKDLDMDKKEIKQIFDQSESKDIPDIFVSYKNHEQAKIRAAEEAERLKRQQQEEQRRLKQEQEKRRQIEAQRAAEQHDSKDQQDEEAQTKTKKGSKKSKGKASKSKKQTKMEAQEEQSKQVPQSKKSQKKSKSDKKSSKKSTKKPEVIEETVDTQVQNNQPQVQSNSEQKVEQVPVTIDVEQVKVSQESKKGKGKKNKKVKESIEENPEQIVQVQHQIVEQIKVEVPEVVETIVIEQVKQEKKKSGQKSKKGKKGSKKVKESPVESQTTETVVPEEQKVTITQQPEAVVSNQTSTEEVPVQVQQAQEPVQVGSDL